jgi:putative peptidoglycan lipid II flippase
MSGWAALCLGVSQIAMLVAIRVASAAQEAAPGQVVASNAIFTLALAIYVIPHSLITVSLATALFTGMSEKIQAGNMPAAREDLVYGLRTTSAFGFFFTAALVVLAVPLARMLQPGITPAEVHALAGPIVAMSLGLVPLAMTVLIRRVYFALEDGRTLFALQVPMSALFAGFSILCLWTLPADWWVIGIGLGQSLSFLAGACLRLASLKDRIGKLGAAPLVWLLARAAAAACLAGEVGYLLLGAWPDQASGAFGPALAAVALVGLAMAVVYVAALRLMGVRELTDFALSLIRRR